MTKTLRQTILISARAPLGPFAAWIFLKLLGLGELKTISSPMVDFDK